MIESTITELALLLTADTALADQYVVFGCDYREWKVPADLQRWFDTFANPALEADGIEFEVSVLTPSVSNNPNTPGLLLGRAVARSSNFW